MNFKMIFHETLNLAFKRTMGKVLCEAWFCLDLGDVVLGFALLYSMVSPIVISFELVCRCTCVYVLYRVLC